MQVVVERVNLYYCNEYKKGTVKKQLAQLLDCTRYFIHILTTKLYKDKKNCC